MPYKVIQVGTGGQGRAWCARFLPPNIADGLIEVVAAVDVNADALINAQREGQRIAGYVDIELALAQVGAFEKQVGRAV